jgi:hypothetical protein
MQRPQMKSIFLASLLSFSGLLFTINAFAQIEFEKGYIINAENQKLECLIKNVDWRDTPRKIEYQLSEDAPVQIAEPISIKEFGVYGYSKYISASLKIDRSSDDNDLNKLSFQRSPEWSEETIFLKVLVEGKASLLFYSEGNFKRFFYQSPDTLEQLVYKKYLTQSGKVGDTKPHNQYLTVENRVAVNISFKQQLLLHTKDCNTFSQNAIKQLRYNINDLTKFFTKYNQCVGGDRVIANSGNTVSTGNKLTKRKSFDLKLFTSINYTSVSVEDYRNLGRDKSRSLHYDEKIGLSLGLETEFILPFNKNKWAIVLGANYQHYSAEKKLYNKRSDNNLFDTLTFSTSIDYKSIEIPVGIRYFCFLNKKSRLAFNIFYIQNNSFGSKIDMDLERPFVISSSGYGFGAGYEFLNFSSEIRYVKNADLIPDHYWGAPYSRISLIIGYRLFRRIR